MTFPWHLYVMAAIYIAAGLNHFRLPKIYQRMIPPALPSPKILNMVSGVAEVALGIALCFTLTSQWAAWGIIVLLLAIFPANVYMYTNKKIAPGIPKWLLLLRLPLQIALIVWAYLYT